MRRGVGDPVGGRGGWVSAFIVWLFRLERESKALLDWVGAGCEGRSVPFGLLRGLSRRDWKRSGRWWRRGGRGIRQWSG